MDGEESELAKAERFARVALQILAVPTNLTTYDWMQLATLVGEADLLIREAQRHDPMLRVPLVDQAIAELYDATGGFTDRRFLKSTGPARRNNRVLFSIA